MYHCARYRVYSTIYVPGGKSYQRHAKKTMNTLYAWNAHNIPPGDDPPGQNVDGINGA
ncbi:hypothetical protein BDV35DRAFT_24561 [Aspergillus flavus]|uniref:Uncharacterized protein n=1 Tax=Aspergillus flavus TaxID=5059 RepID=A0A5N6GJP3_ASPFL|nr:hypothetical protein BDV35DRAFT_24561 [Aspergillus flavus]